MVWCGVCGLQDTVSEHLTKLMEQAETRLRECTDDIETTKSEMDVLKKVV